MSKILSFQYVIHIKVLMNSSAFLGCVCVSVVLTLQKPVCILYLHFELVTVQVLCGWRYVLDSAILEVLDPLSAPGSGPMGRRYFLLSFELLCHGLFPQLTRTFTSNLSLSSEYRMWRRWGPQA